MKEDENAPKSARKLQLNRATLRRLDRDALDQAKGGQLNLSALGACISPHCGTTLCVTRAICED